MRLLRIIFTALFAVIVVCATAFMFLLESVQRGGRNSRRSPAPARDPSAPRPDVIDVVATEIPDDSADR